MAYEQKPGQGSLFENDRKESDKHPDMKGSGICPVCSAALWLSAWWKSGRSEFLSLSMQEKKEQQRGPVGSRETGAKKQQSHLPDPSFPSDTDIPF